MIPRKRLQVLLYILQISYVFGDGTDPGKEDLAVNKLVSSSDIIIPQDDGSSSFTLKPPDENSTDQALTIENPEPPNTNSPKPDNLDYDPKENENHNFQDSNYNELTSELDGKTVIKNLTIDDSKPTSLNVSWNIVGEKSEFFIEVFEDGRFFQKYNTTNLYYNILKLKPCTVYTVKVSTVSSDKHENNSSKDAKTAFMKPGEPSFLEPIPVEPFSIKVVWGPPKIAENCVKHYRVTVVAGATESETVETLERAYTFENLYACVTYNISVTPVDIHNNDALFSYSEKNFTKVPNAPQFEFVANKSIITTKKSIAINWNLSDEKNNCSLTTVHMECIAINTTGHGISFFNGNTTDLVTNETLINGTIKVQINGLSPFTLYGCRANFSNTAGLSNWSTTVYARTNEDISKAPENFESIGYENNMLTFKWSPPDYMPGNLLNYRITFFWYPNYLSPDWCAVNRTKIIDNITPQSTTFSLLGEEPLSHYTAKISARTGAGWSSESKVEVDSLLGSDIPDKVTNLTCRIEAREHNPNILQTTLEWGLPCSLKGTLHYFQVSVVGKYKEQEHLMEDIKISVLESNIDRNDVFNVSLGELKPLFRYNFTVTATLVGATNPGESASEIVDYPPGIPPQPDLDYVESITLDPHKARRTTSTAAILLPLFPDDNGEIKYYAIMVSGVPFDNSSNAVRFSTKGDNWPNVSSWEEAWENDFTIPYQATEPRWKPCKSTSQFIIDYGHMKAVKFNLGEDTTCPIVSTNNKKRVYCNGPLKPDTWYEVRMRAFTEGGYSDSISLRIKTNAELNVPLVLGVVLGILTIGILTTLMVMVRRCSVRLLLQRIAQSSIPESPVPNPFTRRKFINHCQQLAENPGKLSNEFQLLQTLSIDLQMPSNTACLQANRKKNRYSDILPYDFSRVKLEIIDNDPNSDYINASFVRGYSGQEEYIACQGPKEDTTYDFWRMIDQYDIKMIVMLTQLMERGKEKCHQYYPTIRDTAFNFENISIKCTNELDYRTYTQRTLLLQKDENIRTITHLHFKDWPDHDVPDDFDAMIHFCQLFRKQFSANKGIAVIHCSAGIGRTGTLMAIDILLQSIRDNKKLDVFGTVYRLRRHRLNMVQRESQYAFIYNCIRQVLKNPYILKTYKPPPVDPIYPQNQTETERSDASTDLADSFDTLKKNSLSTSIDSMQPLCQSNSPHITPKIQMNGLRYCKSTSAIDNRSNYNRLGKYNSEGYAICESTKDSLSSTSKESAENDLKSSSSSLYENVIPLIRPNSDQTLSESNDYLMKDLDSVEKDTSL